MKDYGDFTDEVFLKIYKRRFYFRRFFMRDWWVLYLRNRKEASGGSEG